MEHRARSKPSPSATTAPTPTSHCSRTPQSISQPRLSAPTTQATYNLRLTSLYNFNSAYSTTPIKLTCSVIGYSLAGVRTTIPTGLTCGFGTLTTTTVNATIGTAGYTTKRWSSALTPATPSPAMLFLRSRPTAGGSPPVEPHWPASSCSDCPHAVASGSRCWEHA